MKVTVEKASILYPVCNQGDELRKTIASAKEGIGDLPHEIIVVDDQSTDGCTRGLPKDVLILRTRSRQGCTGTRKILMEAAKGDVLIWSDPHCRYPADSLKRLAVTAYDWRMDSKPGILLPCTHTLRKGSTVGFGGKYEINERGITVPKKRDGAHKYHPSLVGTVYVGRREVWDGLGGWPVLPGYWGCADTILTLLAWVAEVPIVVATDILTVHRYPTGKTFPYSTKTWGHAANAHWMHKSMFPETYETFWRPHLLRHEKWGRASVMKKVDEVLDSKRFKEFAYFVASKRGPKRTEEQCVKQLLGRLPDGFTARQRGQKTKVVNFGRSRRGERNTAFRWLKEQMNQRIIFRVLDVGCAEGEGMDIIKKYHPKSRVHGVELVPERVKRAKERGRDVVVGDAQAIPKEDESYDLVTFTHVLEHCPDPVAALREAGRVLKPGGTVFAIVPREKRPGSKEHNFCFKTQGDLEKAALEAGLCDPVFGGQKIRRTATASTKGYAPGDHLIKHEMWMSARKKVLPTDEEAYLAYQVSIAPGHRDHEYIRPSRKNAIAWMRRRTSLEGCKVLDVGPRDGFIMEYLVEKGAASVDGIEFSPPAAASAAERGLNVIEGDVRNMPYKDESYDLVTCLHVLEHCPEPKKAMTEMWRVVRPGGHIFVAVPTQRGADGTRLGAHYSFYASETELAAIPLAVCPGAVMDTGTVTIQDGVREIRMVVKKPRSTGGRVDYTEG